MEAKKFQKEKTFVREYHPETEEIGLVNTKGGQRCVPVPRNA